MHSLGELIIPRRCAGCGAPGDHLCSRCKRGLASPPYRVSPAVNPLVPVFALGPYADPHRAVILAMKEHNNMAVRRHIGAVLSAALQYEEARGEIPYGATLVPAPTRPSSARARGGDHVTAMCRHSGYPTVPVLALREGTADQAQLSAAARRTNIATNLELEPGFEAALAGPLIVVDDVVTTGATLESSVATLLAHGGDVAACLVLSAA
ncbi:ComF family protein [Corynebacterium aquatimens]|uniref:Amidophosphoribosyltransferase n=2 Tax=Corynebacterium aquatimens TaxID=1190508 RepID=A0A931DX37_9CORY|nr:putative amidophosphoribosyltransferase [Corynebacterium aquatimens]WJY66510.1 DNA utilization protein GntX [Corynebacterium aquatimens]